MNRIFKYYIVLFSSFISSCFLLPGDKGNPCPPEETPKKHYLSAFDKSKVPYTGADTLTYYSNLGDTVVFVGKGKDSSWYHKTIVTDPDCMPTTDAYEVYGAKYSCIRGQGVFEFMHGKEMPLILKNRPTTEYSNMIEFKVNNLHFIYADWEVGDIRSERFLGTVNLGGYSFNNASFTFVEFRDSSSGVAFYNSSHGLFFIEDKIYNKTWTLMP